MAQKHWRPCYGKSLSLRANRRSEGSGRASRGSLVAAFPDINSPPTGARDKF